MTQEITFKAMGCHMRVVLDSSSRRGQQQMQLVPGWFEEWEQALSRFREDSELSRLNQSAGSAMKVSSILWDVLECSLSAEEASDGLVTATILDALVEAGYAQSFNQVMPGMAVQASKNQYPSSRTSEIQRDVLEKTISLPPDVHLDFGGIAKGWAAHQAAERLKMYGAGLVEAGGDIALSGLQNDGTPWPIAVNDPFDPDGELEMLRLGRCGVATSGKDYRRWQQDGIWMHHIIDPRTGLPAETDVLAATVVAPTVMEAEVAAKVVLIKGSQSGMEWLEKQSRFAGMLVLDNNQRLYSQRMKKYIWR
jgi:thiamine biosynthesis lipoprotein